MENNRSNSDGHSNGSNTRSGKLWEHSENSLIEIFRKIDDENIEDLIDRLRIAWRKEVVRLHHKNPRNMEAKMTEGEEALSLLHRAFRMLKVSEDASTLIDPMEEARRHFENKNYLQAFRCYQSGMEVRQPTIDELCFAGTAALHIKKFDYADEFAEQALMRNSFEWRALVLKGLIKFNEGILQEAQNYFERANRLEPNSKTIIRYLSMTKKRLGFYNPSSVTGKSQTSAASNVIQPNERAKRRWFRRLTQLPITVSNFEEMTATTYKIKSLSAGGALVLGESLPDEFHFSIDLSPQIRIEGRAKKIYTVNNKEFGVLFEGLNPIQQDQINHHLRS